MGARGVGAKAPFLDVVAFQGGGQETGDVVREVAVLGSGSVAQFGGEVYGNCGAQHFARGGELTCGHGVTSCLRLR